ncbi:MAG: phosphoribosyl-AMP cyclohydrolase [bacterium]|nr:phosphoribosyl-AMP cyclohydrolase [bacterium]
MDTGIEEGCNLRLDFNKLEKASKCGRLVPVVVQDTKTKDVILIAYVNEEAFEYSLSHKVAAFWSTSRNELWVKGKTSGDYLEIEDIRINCEQNSLLFIVRLLGKGSCHTRDKYGNPRQGCFYRRIIDGSLEMIA